jgi:hypothetical protein
MRVGAFISKPLSLIVLSSGLASSQPTDKVPLRDECYQTLSLLSEALRKLQITGTSDTNIGAIQCPECNVLHTRAAEAVFPFAVVYQQSGNKSYRDAAIEVGQWLFRQQLAEGQWKETPWEWTGTTADQLLMLSLSFPILKSDLSTAQQKLWLSSIEGAADYLVKYMSPDFASINYCPTTAAALAITHRLVPNPAYLVKAKHLARWTVAKMDDAGFIQGEAARAHGVKYGVDLGYEMDMSLWGLALYARTVGDKFVEHVVRQSLEKNLYFIYPNGAMDASWGSRCYKWTTFGSKTADGCQILFSLFAQEDARYANAALKNLRYLRTMIKDGMIGNGPDFWRLFPSQLCNYPTFARAKNLALAVSYGIQTPAPLLPLPSEQPGWMKFYPTVNVALARSKNFMMTVSAYNYKDLTNTNGGQYNQHPTGGSVCNIWAKDFGFLQTSSQTKYVRGEPIHMPKVNDTVICLTPRIEFSDTSGLFTNLYEFEGRITARSTKDTVAIISTTGELKDERWYQGGVAYRWSHSLFDDAIEKTVTLTFHDRQPTVRIVEPIVETAGTTIEYVSPRKVFIRGAKKSFAFEIVDGNFSVGQDELASRYLFPFPAMKCRPLIITVPPPSDGFEQRVRYRFSTIN